MGKVYKTKIFPNGGSQAVRIPAEFRFDSDEVFISFDELTKTLKISSLPPNSWSDFFGKQDRLLPLIPPEQLSLLDERDQPLMTDFSLSDPEA